MRVRLAALCAALCAAPAPAADWPGFRGPHADGISDAKGVPAEWSEAKNVRWKTAIHGKGWSSPVLVGDQVWLTTADEETAPAAAVPPKKGSPPANNVARVTFAAVCVDRKTGKVVHDVKLRVEEKPAYCHPFNSYASCTPYAEAGRVYAHFGSHGTWCVDAATGKVVWERTDLKCDHFRGPASSPVVYGGKLFLIFDGVDVDYVAALDTATGKTVWKTDRAIKYKSSNPDLWKAYATPALLEEGGKKQLVCPSAECTIAYDPESGKELWRFTHGGMNGSARPVFGNGMMYLTSGHTAKLLAVKQGVAGEVPETAVAWTAAKNVSVRPSLLLAGGLLFMVSDSGIASCLDAKTGAVKWSERLDGEFSASPLLVDGNVIFANQPRENQPGKVFVVAAKPEYTPVAENKLDAGCMASPIAVGDELFIRTKTHLYCVGKK